MTSADVDQKLAAILSADIAGYARLMEDDDEATVRTLRAWREQIGALVAEHRGRVADFTGDNFLASFGTARDAVACAIEIQRVLRARNAGLPAGRRMEFRIGAHLGDVRSEGERLFGDGVNIAARLQSLIEPGEIALSAAVYEQVQSKIEMVCEDLGEKPLKNLANPVRVYRLRTTDVPSAVARPGRTRAIALVAALALVLVCFGVWALWPRLLGLGLDVAGITPPVNPPLPDKPSIVVLPFANLSADPEQEYFADGITEDLTTVLSQSSALFVIARNSAYTYKGRAVKVADVGRELGVRYVLEGSVRRAGERVRITAQLIEAANGFHVWSETYDRELADVFAVQSEIAEQIFVATGAPIVSAELERIRRKPTESLTAYDAVAQGDYHMRRFRVSNLAEARRWFERAVELDPGYAEAVCFLGSTYNIEYISLWTLDLSALDRAESYYQSALELDPGLWRAHFSRSANLLARGQTEQGRRSTERARDLAPNEWRPHMLLALLHAAAGEPVAALDSLQRALRLNPRTSSDAEYMESMAIIYQAAGREEEAVRIWEQARADNPDLIRARLSLAVYYQTAGRHDEARALIVEVLQVNPELTAEGLRRRPEFQRTEAFVRKLEAAGLP